MQIKYIKSLIGTTFLMTSITACNFGHSANSSSSTPNQNTQKTMFNSIKYDDIADTAHKTNNIINRAIQSSNSALTVQLMQNSKLTQLNLKELDEKAMKVYEIYEVYAPERGYFELSLLHIAATTEYQLSPENSKLLWNYLVSDYSTLIAHSIYKKTKIEEDYLLELIQLRTGVCDNLTAFAFSLLKQSPLFENTTMAPLMIGSHVFLGIKFTNSPNLYILDPWLFYLSSDAKKVEPYFGTAIDYLKTLENLPKNIYFDPTGIKEGEAKLLDDLNLTMEIFATEPDQYKAAWGMKYIDISNNSAMESIAHALEEQSKNDK